MARETLVGLYSSELIEDGLVNINDDNKINL